MKKITYLFFFVLLANTTISAQNRRGEKNKIKTLKIAHITEKLDLTSNEAEKFWPIYNAYDKKIHQLRSQEKFKIKRRIKIAGGIDALSDVEAKEIVLKTYAVEKEIYEVRSKFNAKIKSIISYKKIIKLANAEREFRQELIKRLRKRRKFRD